ncbi:molybdopterin-dependent oxidoreductase [Nocardioides sp. Soil777]|uniref:molybdopterin-dependent oxidoreductase n=1 Tax=Nocardioides sp. Soil777 TaxID=1736409 RepID=UPI000A875644|nr:molybdopterin-dependent oxidoreductase [Nocardioides sp. Soil777]
MLIRLLQALYGVLATLVGMAAAHLVAALTVPAASPVLAVGSTVIDLTPTPVKEWAIRTFGTADKPILIGSVLVVVLILAGIAGIVAARRLTLGITMIVGLAAIAGVLALLRPSAGVLDLVPSAVAALVGALTLAGLYRFADPAPAHAVGPSDAMAARTEGDHGHDVDHAEPTTTSASRRTVLIATGGATLAAAAIAGAGRWVTQVRLGGTDIALPAAADKAAALPTGLEERIPGISAFRTPNDDFYRVDTALTVPTIDVDSWSLTIDGDVDQEVELSFDDLAGMRLVERDITLTCVSNDVGGPYIGAARWLGVPLRDVLDQAGIDTTGADQILCTDVDGMTISVPLKVALDGRDALIAIGMNGEALPREHGFPVRMVVPGLYGFVSACKWMVKMTLTTYDEQEAYWTERDWAIDAPIKLSSRIDTPKPLSNGDTGKTFIGGVAWAQGSGIKGVEVRIDGGPWQAAELGPDAGDDYWRQWFYEWDAEPGQHFIASRATNKDGDVQTAVRARPFPEGSSGIQEIAVNVG